MAQYPFVISTGNYSLNYSFEKRIFCVMIRKEFWMRVFASKITDKTSISLGEKIIGIFYACVYFLRFQFGIYVFFALQKYLKFLFYNGFKGFVEKTSHLAISFFLCRNKPNEKVVTQYSSDSISQPLWGNLNHGILYIHSPLIVFGSTKRVIF